MQMQDLNARAASRVGSVPTVKGCQVGSGHDQGRRLSGRLVVAVARTAAFVIVLGVLDLVGLGPAPDAKNVEIAVPQHQPMVLRRQVARPRYTPADRMVVAALARLLPRARWPVCLLTPATLLRRHREVATRRWTYPTTGRGRQGLDRQVVDLVARGAGEPAMGVPADRRGVPQGRRRCFGGLGAKAPTPPPPRASTSAQRAELDRLPARAGRRHSRL